MCYKFMLVETKIKLNKTLYVKDPEETELGKEIINKSIELIYELGLDKFTFKKLAIKIGSNEPSIYRYFENKQQLLSYLNSWYWSWIEFNIDNNIRNIQSNKTKLKIIIQVLTNSSTYDANFGHIDEEKLSHIIIRAYQGIFVDQNKSKKYDIFESFDSLCNKISIVIRDSNPEYSSPKALAISLIKIVHEQIFFLINCSSITEIKDNSFLIAFTENILFSTLKI